MLNGLAPEPDLLPDGGSERTAEEAAAALADLSARYPWRPLDWRWRLARLRAARELPPRISRRLGRGDPWVARAARHLKRLASASRSPRSTRSDPAVETAGHLSAHGGRLRQELEVRILTGQEPAVIAACLDLGTEVVIAYEALRFDIRHRLDDRDHVLFLAIGPRLYEGGLSDSEVQLRLYASLLGLEVVEELIGALLGPAPGRTIDPRLVESLALGRALAVASIEQGGLSRWVRFLDRLLDYDRMARDRSAATVMHPIGRSKGDLRSDSGALEAESCTAVDHLVRALKASEESEPPSDAAPEPPIWLESA